MVEFIVIESFRTGGNIFYVGETFPAHLLQPGQAEELIEDGFIKKKDADTNI